MHRRDLHKSAAQEVQSQMLTADLHTASTLLPQLAHHWFHSGEVAPALQYLMEAGSQVSTTALLYYCTTVLLCYCTSVLLYYCSNVLLCYCAPVLRCYCATVLLCYCTTVLLCYCTTELRCGT